MGSHADVARGTSRSRVRGVGRRDQLQAYEKAGAGRITVVRHNGLSRCLPQCQPKLCCDIFRGKGVDVQCHLHVPESMLPTLLAMVAAERTPAAMTSGVNGGVEALTQMAW
jgi:hypothetical protein